MAKEHVFYNEEKLKQQKRIDAMVAKDPEDYEIKKQVRQKKNTNSSLSRLELTRVHAASREITCSMHSHALLLFLSLFLIIASYFCLLRFLQREVLDETLDMFPDVERRIKAARQDLENLVVCFQRYALPPPCESMPRIIRLMVILHFFAM